MARLFLLFWLLVQALGQDPDPLLVHTVSGPVRGVQVDGGRLRAFRGIPYAAPPVGDARWRPPAVHPGWTSVLDASDFGPSCFQPQCWVSENITHMSEDCLTINILGPPAPTPLPVIVYFHAGEFHCGSSNDAESNQPQFAREVLFVSMNYRVGPFGFLAADELRSRHPQNGTGNYGLLDQRLALEWVHKNIASFGGDPTQVTIMGESSGGTSVAYHLTVGGSAPTTGTAARTRRARTPSARLSGVGSATPHLE